MAGGARRKMLVVAAPGSAFAAATRAAALNPTPGKTALEAGYRNSVVLASGFSHTESVDLDGTFKGAEPNANRWDYGVGVRDAGGREMVFWIEPHSASSTFDVDTMLAKLRWLRSKLETPPFGKLRALTNAARERGSPYRWLVSAGSSVHIAPQSREARRIALAGLEPPRHRVQLP